MHRQAGRTHARGHGTKLRPEFGGHAAAGGHKRVIGRLGALCHQSKRVCEIHDIIKQPRAARERRTDFTLKAPLGVHRTRICFRDT